MKTTATFTLALLALAAPLFAQQVVDPKDVPESVRKAQAEAEQKRLAAVAAQYPVKEHVPPTVRSTDADVQAFIKLLTGSFTSAASGDTPALSLSTSLMTIDGPGIDNAVYFELARADTPWQPFRQGVWQVWKKNGALTVRQYDFAGVPATFKQAIAGFWAAPEVLPVLKSTQLSPIADIALANAGGNYSGTGSGPTLIDGAFEFSTSWVVTPESLSFTDRGTDTSGKQVWGPAQGSSGPTFKRGTPVATVEKRNGGVVVIDFVPPNAKERKLEDWGEAAGVVVGYTDGGTEFYNSQTPNPRSGTIEPYRWQNTPNGGVAGWTLGTMGVTQGTVRRVYVPTALGFGVRGNRNVPPNADLIFTTQVQWVGEPKPPAAPAPNQPPAGAVNPPAPVAKPPAAAATPKGATAVPDSEVPPAVREAYLRDQEKKKQQQQPPK